MLDVYLEKGLKDFVNHNIGVCKIEGNIRITRVKRLHDKREHIRYDYITTETDKDGNTKEHILKMHEFYYKPTLKSELTDLEITYIED